MRYNIDMAYQKLTKEITAVILLACLLLLLSSPKTYASEVYLHLRPTIINIHPLSDGVIEKKITIQNTGRDPLSLDIFMKPFSSTQKGDIIYPATANNTDEVQFISQNVQVLENDIPVSTLSLAPGQTEQVTIHVRINDLLNISEHTFSILFVSDNHNTEMSPLDDNSDTSSQLNIKSGSAVHILITGKKTLVTPPLAITTFSTKSFFEHGPVPFSIDLKNPSTRYQAIYGSILVSNMFGQKVGVLRIPDQIVLANSQKVISTANSSLGNSISWNENTLVGPYTAKLTIIQDDGRENISTLRFFAFPFQKSLILLLLLLFLNIIISGVRRRLV